MSPKRILTALPDRIMPLAVLAAVRGIIAPAGCSTIEYGKRKGFYGSKRMGVAVQPVRQTEQQLLQHLQGCAVCSCGNAEPHPAAEQSAVRHNCVPDVDSTKQRLAVLQQQYDNIQREIQETEGYSSALENKLISKQAQIDKTTTSLHTYEQRLAATGTTLREAGVDTTQLTAETTRLETEVDKLKDQQIDLKKTMDEDAEGATDFGKKSVEAIDAVESVLATAGIAKALGEIKDAYMDCISTAGDFEASMSNVEALSEASGNELEALSDKAKEMGATTKFTAGESADA